MDLFLTRGWEIIIPGCGGTSASAPGATLAARWLHAPANQQSPSGVGVSTPCGAVSTRAICVFVDGLEL